MTTALFHTTWFGISGTSAWIADASGWISHASAWISRASAWIADASSDPRRIGMDPRRIALHARGIRAMSRGIVLGMSLSAFLMEANRLAGVVSRNAERLSAASGGRIGAHTAQEMQKLAEEILRIERERERKVFGPIRPLVRRAEQLVAEIGAAAKFIALEKPIVGEQLRRVRSEGRKRSAGAAAWSLEMHLGLVRAHEREFATALGAGFVEEAATALAALERHRDEQRASAEQATNRTRTRDGLVVQLQTFVGELRRLAGLFVRDPALARQLAAPSAAGARRLRATQAVDPQCH